MGNTSNSRIENSGKSGVLQLSQLQLSKIPEEVKNVHNLRSLNFSDNKLEVLKPWIGDLKHLKVLNLDGNKLTSLPAEICGATKLETLSLNRNLLSTLLPPGASSVSLTSLSNLRFVYLSSNKLTDFPVELCVASIPINVLDLSHNRITLVPTCASALQVVELNLNDNCLTTVASSIATCANLKVLRLERNRLTLDSFPPELLTNSTVSLLCVEGNQFEMRNFHTLPGYAQYMDRYTATKKKTT